VLLENFGSFAFFAFAFRIGKMRNNQNVGWQSIGFLFVIILLCPLCGVHWLLITFSGLAKVAIFTIPIAIGIDAQNQTLINHDLSRLSGKCVCARLNRNGQGVLNRHFCETRFIASGSYSPSLQTIVNIEFLYHFRDGCVLRFLFFLKRWSR